MMQKTFSTSTLFRRHLALPQDHGSWVFLLSPLLIGLFAGGRWSGTSFWVVLGAFAGFLIRQPILVWIKILAKRKARRDLSTALFWMMVYGFIGLVAVIGLVTSGVGYVLWLVVPALPVFVWYLALVYRRAERRQMGVEIVGSGTLALAAAAAYWAGKGEMSSIGWWLWVLTWLQSAASIVYAYLRLEQRVWTQAQNARERVRVGSRAALYATFNLVGSAILSVLGWFSPWLWLPYLVQWGETIWGITHPAMGVKPTSIGFRQLAVSVLFTVVFIIVW